jgi:hypothetical protein
VKTLMRKGWVGVTLELIAPPREFKVAKNRKSHPHLKKSAAAGPGADSVPLHSNPEPSRPEVFSHFRVHACT